VTVIKILAFAVGAGAVAFTIVIAIRTVVLPRAATDPLTRSVFTISYRTFAWWSRRRTTFEARDKAFALFSPMTLLFLPVVWLTVILFGYMAMFWAVGVEGPRRAFTVSGSSLLTLGFAPVDTLPQTVLAFSEAILGLGLVTLLIAYLPTIYGAFRQRELGVGLLSVRAGSPPSGLELLERAARVDWLDHLPEMYASWEEWFVDIEESHTSMPSLVFFRSPRSERSWVTAAGAVLDGAALTTSTLDLPPMPQIWAAARSGVVALQQIADFFGIPYDTDPAAARISVARVEYEAAYDRLVEAGLPVKPDKTQAWLDFADRRAAYDKVLLAMCALTMAPYAPWSSDRSLAVWHRTPTIKRWAKRLRERT
jgi:hypothetical protein